LQPLKISAKKVNRNYKPVAILLAAGFFYLILNEREL